MNGLCANCHKGRTYKRANHNKKLTPNKEKTLKIIRDFKSKKCYDCKIEYPFWINECDHRDPKNKIKDISNFSYWCRLDRQILLIEEFEKCDVVCTNCHRIRTAKQRGLYKSDNQTETLPLISPQLDQCPNLNTSSNPDSST